MLQILIISIIFVLGAGLFIYSIFYTKKTKALNSSKTNKKNNLSRAQAENVVQQLSHLDYYKYADSNELEDLKEDLISSLQQYGVLSTLYYDNPIVSMDYRYYGLDGETLFEEGGFKDALNDMQYFFNKINLTLAITNHIEEENETRDGLNHELTVNGKRYVIFENFKGYGWGEAAQKYAEIINDQLEIQNKEERIYLISGGNDGAAVFLSKEQFQLLDQILLDNEWKPLPVDRWCKFFSVKPIDN